MPYLKRDIKSNFHKGGKWLTYGREKEKVTIISEHGNVLIVQGLKHKFSIKKEDLI